MTEGINLFCPICGEVFVWPFDRPPGPIMHHKEFGFVDCKRCYDAAELKYARLVLRKSE